MQPAANTSCSYCTTWEAACVTRAPTTSTAQARATIKAPSKATKASIDYSAQRIDVGHMQMLPEVAQAGERHYSGA